MSPVMRFGEFRFKPGLNTTIRRGIKWMPSSGSRVPIADETGEVKGAIQVESTASSRFYLVPDDAIAAWHAEIWPDNMRPFARMFHVSQALERCYRMPLFDARELVSVVWFRVVELHGETGLELVARPMPERKKTRGKRED